MNTSLTRHCTTPPTPVKDWLNFTNTFTAANLLPVNMSCNFNNGLCGFIQANDDVFDWQLKSGPTSTILTGPECDLNNCTQGKLILKNIIVRGWIRTSQARQDLKCVGKIIVNHVCFVYLYLYLIRIYTPHGYA